MKLPLRRTDEQVKRRTANQPQRGKKKGLIRNASNRSHSHKISESAALTLTERGGRHARSHEQRSDKHGDGNQRWRRRTNNDDQVRPGGVE